MQHLDAALTLVNRKAFVAGAGGAALVPWSGTHDHTFQGAVRG
jgi:hypothetical protein